MNKSELMVQNFIKGLGTNISDDEVMNKILGFFSDIPTPYHAMDKIKFIKQNNKPMSQFNEKYGMYIKHPEMKAIHDMTSLTQMELYMSAINPHIAKALRTNIHYGLMKAEECYLKDLYTRAGLEKDREQNMADKEVTCTKINMRSKNQWQTGGDRQRSWPSQENQGNRSSFSYQKSYDGCDREDSTENNRVYKNNTSSNREAETKRTDQKQHEFSKNSQRLQPAAVARGGYTQIVVNPMQLEDETFTASMQRLTEARRNR